MKLNLNNLAILKIDGPDTESFLQSQLTNDISKIGPSQVQLNAYCQHQGKIICLLYVIKEKDFFFLLVNHELKSKLLETFMKYKFLSQINFSDMSEKLNLYCSTSSDEKLNFILDQNFSFSISSAFESVKTSENLWDMECIKFHIPEIYIATSELFTPEQINIDINDFAVSFTKGCYPGQEVVARMHYLGNKKRRMFKFISDNPIKPGDKLFSATSNSIKPSGEVVRVARKKNQYVFLASFESKNLFNPISVNSLLGSKVSVIND